MNTSPSGFIIRVYALIVNGKQEVLVSDETRFDLKMTKFPGGGLQQGEGLIDCLKREMMEEARQEIEDIRHFYTTDFFQKAMFFTDQQLISIYYTAKIKGDIQFRVSDKAFNFDETVNESQSFRWISLEQLNPDEFTFPIDKHVAHLLKQTQHLKN